MHLTASHWREYCQLIRFDKPIGTTLVLWPALWALWLASHGNPSVKNLVIFILGAFFMRSAGCIVNDFADRKFDGHVKRTENRPLATGSISFKEARELFIILLGISFILVLFTNLFTIKLAFGGVLLAVIYPFMKRITYLPQFVLGLAYAYPVLMGWGAEQAHIPAAAWWLYAGTFCWIVAFDTWYAMVDREDDLRIGLKSTAILFGSLDKIIIALFQIVMLICFIVSGILLHRNGYFYFGLLVILGLLAYQQYLTKDRNREGCFAAFMNNNWVGSIMFIGILASLL